MVKVGCCGFAGARGRYFRAFRVVEVQSTFYQPPRLETVRRWREEAPEGFEFTLKAWQLITHEPSSPTYRRLRTRLDEAQKRQAGAFRWTELTRHAWEVTAAVARALEADKVLFQCPASFGPTAENLERMRRFFGEIRREGVTCLWEPRGGWPPEQVAELCRELGLVHCVDPFKDTPVTEGLRYFRLHGVGGYRHRYSDAELRRLLLKCCGGAGEAYCMFNNISMFEDARRFLELAGDTARGR